MIILSLIIVVLGDAATKLFAFSPAPSAIVKGLLLIPLVILSFKNDRPLLILLLILLFLFFIGCSLHSVSFFFQSIPQFFEYFFGVFFFISFKDSNWNTLSVPLNIIFLTHASIILIAVIFQISFFKTYYSPDRFGYISLFNSQNEFSFILMAGLIFFFHKFWSKRKLIDLMKLLVFTLAGLMVGTKAFLLFVLIILVVVLFSKITFYRSLGISIIVLFAVWLSKSFLLSLAKNHFGIFFKLYQKEGLLSVISSQRTILFKERFADYKGQNSVVNFLFGGGKMDQIFEMSFFDILSFLGVFGFAIYLYLIYTRILRHLHFPRIYKLFFGSLILISVFSGYLLDNASAQLYTLAVGMFISANIGSSIGANIRREEKNMNK